VRQASHAIPEIQLSDGTVIPQLGFGTLRVQPDRESTPANVATTAEIVRLALQAGYRHIDTAQSYGTEAGVGRAIAGSGIPRGELYVTSKLGNGRDGVRRRGHAPHRWRLQLLARAPGPPRRRDRDHPGR
jgi:2,5-diketo-D-gluconate reductase A